MIGNLNVIYKINVTLLGIKEKFIIWTHSMYFTTNVLIFSDWFCDPGSQQFLFFNAFGVNCCVCVWCCVLTVMNGVSGFSMQVRMVTLLYSKLTILNPTASGTARTTANTQIHTISTAVDAGIPTPCTRLQDATARYLNTHTHMHRISQMVPYNHCDYGKTSQKMCVTCPHWEHTDSELWSPQKLSVRTAWVCTETDQTHCHQRAIASPAAATQTHKTQERRRMHMFQKSFWWHFFQFFKQLS